MRMGSRTGTMAAMAALGLSMVMPTHERYYKPRGGRRSGTSRRNPGSESNTTLRRQKMDELTRQGIKWWMTQAKSKGGG